MGLIGAFHAFLLDGSELVADGASARTYRCTECDNEVSVDPAQSLPPCLICKSHAWEPREAAQRPVVVPRVARR